MIGNLGPGSFAALPVFKRVSSVINPAVANDSFTVPGAGANSLKLGNNALAAYARSIGLGDDAAPTITNELAIGGAGAGEGIYSLRFAERGVTIQFPSANTMQLASGDAFVPEDSSQNLGASLNRWIAYAWGVSVGFGASSHGTPSYGNINISGALVIHGSSLSNDIYVQLEKTNGLTLNQNHSVRWSAQSILTPVDTGLKRYSAGVVKVTDGSTGMGSIYTGSVYVNTATPSQITAAQNDYSLDTKCGFFRLSTDASRSITGFADGSNGRVVMIANVGSNDLVLANENAGSAEANRIITGTGADLTLAADASCWLIYDDSSDRWRVRQ